MAEITAGCKGCAECECAPDLIARLRIYRTGTAPYEAADALDRQAARIAELEAERVEIVKETLEAAANIANRPAWASFDSEDAIRAINPQDVLKGMK